MYLNAIIYYLDVTNYFDILRKHSFFFLIVMS